VSAYKRHLRHQQTPCAKCRKAWAEYHRKRYEDQKRICGSLSSERIPPTAIVAATSAEMSPVEFFRDQV